MLVPGCTVAMVWGREWGYKKIKSFTWCSWGYEGIKLLLSYTSISEIVEKYTDKFKHDVKKTAMVASEILCLSLPVGKGMGEIGTGSY